MSQCAPVELFRCDRTGMKLTPAGCARLFQSTREERPRPWEGRFACIACPIGAVNAGEDADPCAAAIEVWRSCCVRCLVGGYRLIGGSLCVSCYNRDREAAIGRDRKGHRPRLADHLHYIAISLVQGDTTASLQADRALSATEILVAAAKHATGIMSFGWRPPDVGG
jgi:hypothetical protein